MRDHWWIAGIAGAAVAGCLLAWRLARHSALVHDSHAENGRLESCEAKIDTMFDMMGRVCDAAGITPETHPRPPLRVVGTMPEAG
jgi:hypothetical protein